MKKLFMVLFYIIIGFFLYSLGHTTCESIIINKKTNEFKKRAKLVKTENKRRFYEIEDPNLEGNPFTQITKERTMVGKPGDILTTRIGPFEHKPFINSIFGFYFGGHAALVMAHNKLGEIAGWLPKDSEEKIKDYIFTRVKYDSKGNPTHNLHIGIVDTNYNYFTDPNPSFIDDEAIKKRGHTYYKNKFYLLGVKTNEKNKENAVKNIEILHKKRMPYNFLFCLDTKEKCYCTDLMTKIYGHLNNNCANLNQDGFITTVNDLILSSDTYIKLYFELDKDGYENYYYIK